MTKLRVVVDDLRTFVEDKDNAGAGNVFETIYLRTSDEALLWFIKFEMQKVNQEHSHIDELWLDNDLGLKSQADGMIIVDWLKCRDITLPFRIEVIYIHTANPSASQMMYRALDRASIWPVHRVDATTYGLLDFSGT